MSWQKFPPPVAILMGIVSSTLVTSAILPPQPIAASTPERKSTFQFPLLKDVKIPSSRWGDSTQSFYVQNTLPIALLPNSGLGMTVAANPTLFVYVPKTLVQQAELTVFDEKSNEVYRTTFGLTGTPGIVRLSLPATVSLEIGKDYEWALEFINDPIDRSIDLFVGGRLQRTELSPELKTKLENESDPLEQAKLYAQGHIWHETLTILASLRESHPDDWQGLLASVGLGQIAQAPFVNCCTTQD